MFNVFPQMSTLFLSWTHRKNADANIENQKAIEDKREQLQLKLSYLRSEHSKEMQENNFAFQEKLRKLDREAQKELTVFMKQVDLKIATQNLDFQKWRAEQEQALHQQLAAYNRETQLIIAAHQRKTAFKQIEYHKILDNWPLKVFPAQILSNSYTSAVPLKILLNPISLKFDKYAPSKSNFSDIEHKIAKKLHAISSSYYPKQTHPTKILDGAWDSSRYYGGASREALFSMLKSDPVVIIDIEHDKENESITFSLAYWEEAATDFVYKPNILEIPYVHLLNTYAKARALKWKADVYDKKLAAGMKLEEIIAEEDKKGLVGKNNIANFKILQAAQKNNSDIEPVYQYNKDDWQKLVDDIATYHNILVYLLTDVHFLLANKKLPLLPTFLNQLLQTCHKEQKDHLLNIVYAVYTEGLKTLSQLYPYETPSIALQIAENLFDAIGNNEYTSHIVLQSYQLWQAQKEQSTTAHLPTIFTQNDENYLAFLKRMVGKLPQNKSLQPINQTLFVLQEGNKNQKTNKKITTMKDIYLKSLEDLHTIAEKQELSPHIFDDINALKQKITIFQVKIPLIGGFNAGKSSLLNKTLNRELLPVKIIPETAIATELKYGVNEKIVAHTSLESKNDQTKVFQLQDISKISSKDYAYIELFINHSYIKKMGDRNIVLVDMPGLNSENKEHEQAINKYFKEGAFYLFLSSMEKGVLNRDILKKIKELKGYAKEGKQHLDFALILTWYDTKQPHEIEKIIEKEQKRLNKIANKEIFVGKTSTIYEDIEDFKVVIENINLNAFLKKTFKLSVTKVCKDITAGLKVLIGVMDYSDKLDELDNKKREFEKNIKDKKDFFDKELKYILQEFENNTKEEITSVVIKDLEKKMPTLVKAAKNNTFAQELNDIIRPKLTNTFSNVVKLILRKKGKSISEQFQSLGEEIEITSDFYMDMNESSDLAAALTLVTTLVALPIFGPLAAMITTIGGTLTSIFLREENPDIKIENKITKEVIPSIKDSLNDIVLAKLIDVYDIFESKLNEQLQKEVQNFNHAIAEVEKLRYLEKEKIAEIKQKVTTEVNREIRNIRVIENRINSL